MTFSQAVQALDEFSKLKPGWDGYRAPTPLPEVIQMAKAVLGRLGEGFEPCPCPDGSIDLERNDDEFDIIVNIDKARK